MGGEFDARDQYGNRYKARRAGGGGNAVDKYGNRYTVRNIGDGCFSSIAFWIMALAFVVTAIVLIFTQISAVIGNGIFSPYHVFTADHNDAVRTAVRNHVGKDKYAGLFETDAGTGGFFLSATDSHFTNVKLDRELGGFPGKAYTIDKAAASDWFEFDTVGIQRQGHCYLIVYIQPTAVQHTIYARISDNGDQQAYTFHIQAGEDSGSVDIGTPASDQYAYTVYIQGDVGTPFEAIVVDRSEQESSTSSSTSIQTKPTPRPTPIRLAAKYSGSFIPTYSYSGAYNGEKHTNTLEITTTNTNGSFQGKWYDTYPTHGDQDTAETDVYSVQGVSVPFDQVSRFSQLDSFKIQDLQKQYGDNGVLLQFTITGIISSSDYIYNTGGLMNTDFYGVLSNGTVQGVWFSTDANNGGTFKLSS